MKIQKLKTNILLVLIFSFLSQSVFSQYRLQVKLTQPPLNQLRATDIWRLNIFNPAKSPLEVTLHGTLEESNSGIVVEGYSNIIRLSPGSKIITYDDVKSGSVSFKSGKWREAFLNTGNAPSGDYRICITVTNKSGEELGSDCIDQKIEIASPPSLISPADGETIAAEMQPVFTWVAPIPTPSGQINYKLKIVEVIGGQSPQSAVQRNPALFEQSGIISTMFQYPSSAKKLESNKKYGWVVHALNREGKPIGSNNGTSETFSFRKGGTIISFDTNNVTVSKTEKDSTNGQNGQTKSLTITNLEDSTGLTSDKGTATAGDTIKAGLNGEFKIAVTQTTTESDGSLTGNGKVYIKWLKTNVAVEFKKIKIDTTKNLISGGIVSSQGGSTSTSWTTYPLAWGQSLLSGPGAANAVDNAVDWTNNLIENVVNWTINTNVGYPIIDYQSNIAPPPIPDNSLKMPFGLQFDNGNQKLVITEMVFKPNESKINFLAQGKFIKSGTIYTLGFAGKYFKFHPKKIEFNSGRVELAENFEIPNVASNPKMKFLFKKGDDNSGCYIEWDSTGVKDVGLELGVKFTREWLLPVPSSSDSVEATLGGNGTSMNDILLTGSLPNCEIVGTNGIKMFADSLSLDLSDTRNPSSIHFPNNYLNDTSATWRGFYVKSFGATMPESWTTGNNSASPSITANNFIIDDMGITTKIKAVNVLDLQSGKIADLSASLDTVEISILNSSLENGIAKGKIVLPISEVAPQNTLKYTAVFAQVQGANNFVLTVLPNGPIEAEVLKGKITLLPTSNISAAITPTTKSASINMNGTFSWDSPNFPSVGSSIPVKGVKMELDFENVGLNYTSTSSASSLDFNPGSWSFASPQKFMANFPVSIKKVYYKSLNKTSPELLRGALMIDVVANLTDNIGGATTLGAGFAIERNPTTKKFTPKFKGVFVDSISVHANMQAVKIDGSIALRNNDPVYGNGFLGQLNVDFTSVGISADALVEFGNTNYQNGNNLYRYWRVEADVVLPPPGVPFLTGLAFRGFGGGAYFNMDASLSPSGTKYTFKPKKSDFGLRAKAIIATTPKEETFNADVGLLAQFSSSQGLTLISFTGDFYVGAGLAAASRAKANVKGDVSVSYNFPDKHFNLSSNVFVNAPPITTPSPSNLVLDIDGKHSKWYFKFGEPAHTNTVNVFGVSLYEYLMFGNDIPAPAGFTQTFKNGYHGVFGYYPGMAVTTSGVTGNSNTATGRGLALGIGFKFNKDIDFNLVGNFDAHLGLGAGAELNLAYNEYTGQNCENPSERIGINGWQASGSIGFYAYVNASVKRKNKTWNIADIKAGGWLQGRFPNPVYAAGEVTGTVKIAKLINTSFTRSFVYGTNCSGISSAGSGAAVTQGDAAGDQQQLLIKYVHPDIQYNFPEVSPLTVQYGLTPDNVFDVAEQQADGSVKTRTFKMVVSPVLKINNGGGSYTNVSLKKHENNLGEYLYTVFTQPVVNTSTPYSSSSNLTGLNVAIGKTITTNNSPVSGASLSVNQLHASNSSSFSLNNLAVLNYPVPPSTPSYGNLPPEPPAIVNHLTAGKDYVFTITATLKEFVNNIWIDAKNKNNVVVKQTVNKIFRTGPMVILSNTVDYKTIKKQSR